MKREVIYYNMAMIGRVNLNELRTPADAVRAVFYINNARGLAEKLDIPGFPVEKINLKYADITIEKIAPSLFLVESFLNDIRLENIFELDGTLQQQFIHLDSEWRSLVSTHLHHARALIRNAEDIEERLRNSIMQRLSDLEAEVERNQTRLSSALDMFVETTEALSKGAVKLRPLVRVVGQVVGILSAAKRANRETKDAPQLPKPEALGIEKAEDANDVSSEAKDNGIGSEGSAEK